MMTITTTPGVNERGRVAVAHGTWYGMSYLNAAAKEIAGSDLPTDFRYHQWIEKQTPETVDRVYAAVERRYSLYDPA
jgi:hypothetical protein